MADVTTPTPDGRERCETCGQTYRAPEPAARVGGEASDGELERIRRALATDDNACTAHAIYIVEKRVRDIGMDPGYTELICWYNAPSEEELLSGDARDGDQFNELENVYQQTGNIPMDWVRTGYRERWEFVQPFLTRGAAEAYGASQAHNLGKWRVYVESGYRNPEWQWLRCHLANAGREGRTDERSAQAGDMATSDRDMIHRLRALACSLSGAEANAVAGAVQRLAERDRRIGELEAHVQQAEHELSEADRALAGCRPELTRGTRVLAACERLAAYEPVVRAALWGSVETVRAAAECIPAELRPGASGSQKPAGELPDLRPGDDRKDENQ